MPHIIVPMCMVLVLLITSLIAQARDEQMIVDNTSSRLVLLLAHNEWTQIRREFYVSSPAQLRGVFTEYVEDANDYELLEDIEMARGVFILDMRVRSKGQRIIYAEWKYVATYYDPEGLILIEHRRELEGVADRLDITLVGKVYGDSYLLYGTTTFELSLL